MGQCLCWLNKIGQRAEIVRQKSNKGESEQRHPLRQKHEKHKSLSKEKEPLLFLLGWGVEGEHNTHGKVAPTESEVNP